MKRKLEILETDPTEKIRKEVPTEMHKQWMSTWGDSQSFEDFFSHDELEWLTDLMYRHHFRRRVRPNGTLHFKVDNNLIRDKFYDKIKTVVPELDYTDNWHGNFLMTTSPYNLHIDTDAEEGFKNGTVPGKQILIPLFVCCAGWKDHDEDWHPNCGTAFYKNRFLMYGTNFAKSDETYYTNVFHTVTDYNTLTMYDKHGEIVDNDWSKPFDETIYNKYLTNLRKEWLDGFELDTIHNWKRGNMIVFDRCQPHSGVDFRKDRVTLKAGLSLMTTKKVR